MNNKEFCEQIKVNDIPWDRIVGCYDRATNFPDLISKLNSKNNIEREDALKEIILNIEHQSTLYTVTPITLIFLFRTLQSLDIEEKDNAKFINNILDLILRISNIVKLNIENAKHQNPKIENLKGLLSDEYLWEKFESEEQDEINWEENILSEDYYLSLNFNVVDVMKINYSIIKNISVLYKKKGKEIMNLINTFKP